MSLPQGSASPASAQHMVNGDWTAAKEYEPKGNGGRSHRKLISWTVGRSDESVVQVHFPNGDEQIYKNGERGGAGKKSRQNQQAAEKFGEGGNIAQPSGEAEIGDHLRVVVQTSENFVVAMRHHDDSQGEAHYQ